VSGHLGGSKIHGSKLRHPENPVIAADTVGPIENETFGRQFDRTSNNGHRDTQQRQQKETEDEIEGPLRV